MDQREEEILLNVACGLDPLTAIVAAADDPKPPKKPSGCLLQVLAVLTLYWLLLR